MGCTTTSVARLQPGLLPLQLPDQFRDDAVLVQGGHSFGEVHHHGNNGASQEIPGIGVPRQCGLMFKFFCCHMQQICIKHKYTYADVYICRHGALHTLDSDFLHMDVLGPKESLHFLFYKTTNLEP